MNRKAIILAGGNGSRLYPTTLGVSKQLLPVFDRPMVYYPLSVAMLTNIREILLISTPRDIPNFQRLLRNGNQWGIDIQYMVQPAPEGLAQALVLGEQFIDGHPSLLILGDNIFYGHLFHKFLESADKRINGATIFAYRVKNPEQYGVVEFDKNTLVKGIEEKPKKPKSNYAVTGLYFYDKNAPKYAKELKPSKRNELEITDLNLFYKRQKMLFLEIMGRGYVWFDAGTHENLIEANQFVQAVEHRQKLKIACLEEIAFQKGWISSEEVEKMAHFMQDTNYSKYLLSMIEKGGLQ